jgi:hypothetical protein
MRLLALFPKRIVQEHGDSVLQKFCSSAGNRRGVRTVSGYCLPFGDMDVKSTHSNRRVGCGDDSLVLPHEEIPFVPGKR